MKLENPFFTREVRQHGARPAPLQLGMLIIWTVFSLVLLLLHDAHSTERQPTASSSPLLWFLAVPHIGLCILAATYGTDRIFGDEHRRGTLEGVLLLPCTAWQWLFQRLLYPLYLVGIAWLLGVPIYLLAGVIGVGTVEAAFRFSLAAPLTALCVIPALLLLPPDYRERMRRYQGVQRRPQHGDFDLTLWWFSTVGAALLCLFTLPHWLLTGSTVLYAGNITLPLWWLIGPTLGILLACAGAMSLMVLSTNEATLRRARIIRCVGALGLYYTMVVWLSLQLRPPLWISVPAALLPLYSLNASAYLLFYLRRRRPTQRPAIKRRNDSWSIQEFRWAAAFSANPVFLKDIASYLQGASFRRMILLETLVLLVILPVGSYVILQRGGGLVDLGQLIATVTLIFGPLTLLKEICQRPFGLWMKERTAGTLPLLFLTPISSAQILRGRIRAAILYVLACHLPLLLLILFSLIWVVGNIAWEILPVSLALSPLAALFIVVLSSTVQPQTLAPWRWNLEDWSEAGLSVFQIAMLFMQLHFIGDTWREDSMWLGAIFAFALNTAVVVACYYLRLRQFELFRSGERPIHTH